MIIDYINRFWIHEVDARVQLFDLKTKYQFQTAPGYDQYNMPLYGVQVEPAGNIAYYPKYQGFLSPVYINGIQIPLQIQKNPFFNTWPNVVQQNVSVELGNGDDGPYSFTIPISPVNPTPPQVPFQYLLRGHVDIQGIAAFINSGNSYADPPIVTDLNTDIAQSNTFPAVYITANGVDGSSIVVTDSGQFLTGNQNLGLLCYQQQGQMGNTALPGGYASTFAITGATQANPAVLTAATTFQVGQQVTIVGVTGMTELNGNTYTILAVSPTTVTIDVDSSGFTAYVSGGSASTLSNVINYLTGEITELFFPVPVPDNVPISVQCFNFQCGLPRGVLYNNNTLTFRSPPDRQYLVELDAYLSPAAFISSGEFIQYAYMCEYIARGAARKILSDTGDVEQFQFYEPLFREQETLVWKRSQRQFTSDRTHTIYSQGLGQGQLGYNSQGGTTF